MVGLIGASGSGKSTYCDTSPVWSPEIPNPVRSMFLAVKFKMPVKCPVAFAPSVAGLGLSSNTLIWSTGSAS